MTGYPVPEPVYQPAIASVHYACGMLRCRSNAGVKGVLAMKSTILERYPRAPDGRYIIDITAGRVSDLYNDFDKLAPYVRKELGQDLVEYITDSVRELGREAFTIRFHLVEPPDEAMMGRVTTSINSYFLYLKTIELHELGRVIRASLIYLVVGIALLFLTVWVNEKLTPDAAVLSRVFSQGLTVAAWVSLWEALATFLVNWTPYTRQISMYERIAGAPVQFMPAPVPASLAPSG
jgi:hypothetical protein